MLKVFLRWAFRLLSVTSKEKIKDYNEGFLWRTYVNFYAKRAGGVYFGQNLEDQVLSQYLTEPKGAYVDIGAGWPVQGSNTYFFYIQGWSGITVDPIKSNFELHKLFRKRDKQVQALIGCVPGVVDFYRFEPYEYSTSNPEVAKEVAMRDDTRLIEIERHQILRLDELRIHGLPLEPTLLSVDVEGNDIEVLKSNNWTEYLPRVICIETWSNQIDYEDEIIKFLAQYDYQLVSEMSVSRIFVHLSYLALQG
jgi:hypothetical protein